MTRTPPPFPAPAAQFERHFRWRWWAIVGFLGLMLGLAAMALASILVPPRILGGVPDDDDARAAWALMPPAMDVGLLELRFDSELGVSSTPSGRVHPDQLRRAERAESLLVAALRRHPDDPRLHAAIGHLDLVRQSPHHAEQRYLAAVDLAPHHDEARLGLGVTLARLAALEADPIERRRLELRAIAQLAAVRDQAPVRLDAVYDRAVLLAQVGRAEEARKWAALYLASDSSSAWAAQLRERVPGS
ncbi:MAG TPA: hypothetical protein VMJ70_00860 [Candidatus Sulfotelmatobacter sp.]|nr:hypothetical protein [Candidatus Sulfotelmatobacter sp.]